ncbi:MAG: SMC-Scp complex subunit ScpB [Candidatus Latescibacterota bacterium]
MSEPLPPEQARSVIEAVLLSAESPVTAGRLAEVVDGHGAREVARLVDELREEYGRTGRGFTIVEVAGGYQLATRSELSPWLRRFHKDRHQVRLSQAALETLAIIAFKQPLTRMEVDSIRGVNSAGVLQTLMEVGMVRITGRSDGIGKPMLFGTTREFLVHFGLKNLADLPKPKELEELLAEGEQKARAREQGTGEGDLPRTEDESAAVVTEDADVEGLTPEPVVAWDEDTVDELEPADAGDEDLEDDAANDDPDADAKGPESDAAGDVAGNEGAADEAASADAERPASER